MESIWSRISEEVLMAEVDRSPLCQNQMETKLDFNVVLVPFVHPA